MAFPRLKLAQSGGFGGRLCESNGRHTECERQESQFTVHFHDLSCWPFPYHFENDGVETVIKQLY